MLFADNQSSSSDFENPYEMVNDDDDYPPAAGTGAAYDSIEEISDNEVQ